MARLPMHCPSCAAPLMAVQLRCPSCDIRMEGEFQWPPLVRLPEDDLRFIQEFVLVSGSLKAMSQVRNLSYPTLRNRLDDIIARLKALPDGEAQRRSILDAIADGTLSVPEAVEKLKGLK